MIFSSFQYLFFLATVILLLIIIPGQSRRKVVLLAASYLFYAFWDYRFLVLIWTSTAIDSMVGKAIYKSDDPRKRKVLLAISVTANLGILGFFKYFNFFAESAAVILSGWGWEYDTLNIILPVGISFYTFQTMSYTIDIYRRTLKPADTLLDFALFVAFFPQLVAGPIVRAADFLPQLKEKIGIRSDNVWAGMQIFTVGLFKKLMIADGVAPFVNQFYSNPDYYSPATAWLGIIAYSIQIYCDFSGYSDMAIGTARMLGFRFERNFFMPYISQNATEFWQRWHISLSTWLRDYLYIPLGGNRKGNFRTYVNLMITMLLGGLWHGASWNFVIWGGVHGLALVIHRMWRQHVTIRGRPILSFGDGVLTFVFVTLVWVLFRAQDVATMTAVYSKVFFLNTSGVDWFYQYFFIASAMMIIGYYVGLHRDSDELVFFDSPRSFRAAFAMVSTLLIIYIFAPTNNNPFIYFQF